MTNGIANLFVDTHPYNAKLIVFLHGNYYLIASTISEYSLRLGLQRVLADESTSLLRIALYDIHSLRFDIVFQGMWTETNLNMR